MVSQAEMSPSGASGLKSLSTGSTNGSAGGNSVIKVNALMRIRIYYYHYIILPTDNLPPCRDVPQFLSIIPKWNGEQHDTRLDSNHLPECGLISRTNDPRDNPVRKTKRKNILETADEDQRFECNQIIRIDD